MISGSAGTSFQPTYQTSPAPTNRIASLPGGITPTYDANGNSTNDSFHQFTWDAENRPVTVVSGSATVSVTYDALGRMVEQARGTAYTQIVYSPLGSKIATMNGTTLVKGFFPLTSGASAVYTSTGLAYYRHADHLGSSRFASTPSRAMYSDTAYSAFGEPYAQAGTADPSYTGQDQDTTAGLYDFTFRKYDPGQSRWISPDPSGLAAVNPAFPQSWNRYSYVLNNPLNATDPTGLFCVYMDNADASVESIDYDSSSDECAGTGGTWFPDGGGTTANGNPSGQQVCSSIGGVATGCTDTNNTGNTNSSPLIDWSWWGNFATTFFTTNPFAISTGPGSCLGVALNTVRAPLEITKKVAENADKYAKPVANALAATGMTVANGLNAMSRAKQLSPILGPAVASGATTVASGLNTVAEGVATAAPYVATGFFAAVDVIGFVAVGKEAYAAATGTCHP